MSGHSCRSRLSNGDSFCSGIDGKLTSVAVELLSTIAETSRNTDRGVPWLGRRQIAPRLDGFVARLFCEHAH